MHMTQPKIYTNSFTHPILRTSMYLVKPNIAGFRLLRTSPLLHGFTYGKGSQNMSYKWEPGVTEQETKDEAIQRVKQRIENHLALLGMAPIGNSVFLQALSGDTRIVDLSTRTL